MTRKTVVRSLKVCILLAYWTMKGKQNCSTFEHMGLRNKALLVTWSYKYLDKHLEPGLNTAAIGLPPS